jgi:TRAP transporter TAXI family solute receptor
VEEAKSRTANGRAFDKVLDFTKKKYLGGVAMKTLKICWVGIWIIMLLVLGLLQPYNCESETVYVRNGAVPPTSGHYAYNVVVNEIWSKLPNYNVTLIVDPGGVTRMQRIAAGQIDTGIAVFENAYEMWSGKGTWKKAYPQLRGHWIFNAQAYAYVVRADSGITSIEQLAGKKFAPGARGSGTEAMNLAFVKAAGIKPDWALGTQADQIKQMQDRRIVGFVKAQPLNAIDSMIQQVMATQRIRVLSWPRHLAEKALKAYPGYSMIEIAAGTYPYDWNKEPILTLALGLGYVATSAMPEDVAYQTVKAICEDKTMQASAYPPARAFNFIEITLKGAKLPLHRGVVKYFKEKGYKVPDYLVPQR